MKINIDVNKGEANVDMEISNLRPSEVLSDYITAVNALTDAYTKIIKALDIPKETINLLSAFVNTAIKENLNESISYKEDKLVEVSYGLFKAITTMLGDIDFKTLEKMKEELKKMEDK